jgi:hypothetical protein
MLTKQSGKNTEEANSRRLGAVMAAWKSPEPSAGFEASVWKRIRAGSVPVTRVERFRLLSHPAWAAALAASVAILLGVGARVVMPAAHASRHAPEPLFESQTLAGAYLALAGGSAR